MTASDVVLDSWAWWEILHQTAVGRQLRKKYVGRAAPRTHTSVLALAELCARLHQLGHPDRVPVIVAALRAQSRVHDVTLPQGLIGAAIRHELRSRHPHASLADGIMLALARELKAVLISGDPAFKGLSDVRDA